MKLFLNILLFSKILDPVTGYQTSKKATFGDVYNELAKNLSHDFKCKKVTKNFAFHVPNVDIPETSDYFKVKEFLQITQI